MKKLLIIGAIALVVIGCVLAAGCTSTTEIPSADDQIIGLWISDDKTAAFVLSSDLTGVYGNMNDSALSEGIKINWVKNKDGTYNITYGNTMTTVKLDPVKELFTTESGTTFTKMTSENSGSILGDINDARELGTWILDLCYDAAQANLNSMIKGLELILPDSDTGVTDLGDGFKGASADFSGSGVTDLGDGFKGASADFSGAGVTDLGDGFKGASASF